MAERPRDACSSFKGVGHFEVNFRLKVYILCQYMDRQSGQCLYYNYAARSFHTRKLCSRLYSTEIASYWKKKQKKLFEPPFRGLGVTYALEMDRSSAFAELRPENSAERSARFGSATCELFGGTSAKLQQKFGINFAVLRLRRFALIWSQCTL